MGSRFDDPCDSRIENKSAFEWQLFASPQMLLLLVLLVFFHLIDASPKGIPEQGALALRTPPTRKSTRKMRLAKSRKRLAMIPCQPSKVVSLVSSRKLLFARSKSHATNTAAAKSKSRSAALLLLAREQKFPHPNPIAGDG